MNSDFAAVFFDIECLAFILAGAPDPPRQRRPPREMDQEFPLAALALEPVGH
jgi:hypothetical protein